MAEGAKVEGGLQEAWYARAVVWMRGLSGSTSQERRRQRACVGARERGEGAEGMERERDRRREAKRGEERNVAEREARGLDGLDSPARCY